MKQYIFLWSAFVHRSPNSFLFFLLFSLFFQPSFFQKLWQSVFLFFSFYPHLFFVHAFPCVSNSARSCRQGLVRDEALRSVALNQNKKFCLTEDAQSRFLGNCLPTPPLTNRWHYWGFSICRKFRLFQPCFSYFWCIFCKDLCLVFHFCFF